MKLQVVFWMLILLVLIGCQPQDVKVTITYDKNAQNVYPYSTYGDIAKIYYTIAGKNYEHSVGNHRSIEIVVREKTQMRATYDKYISDANGARATLEDSYYTVDKNNPMWKF